MARSDRGKGINTRGNIKALLLAALVWPHGLGAASQDISENIRESLENEDDNRAEFLQAFSLIGVVPGANSSTIAVESDNPDASDFEVKLIKIPISRELKHGTFCIADADGQRNSDKTIVLHRRSQSSVDFCMTPYAELSLSYLRGEQSINLRNIATSFTNDIKALSVFGGLGMSIPLADNAIIRPIFLAGYSRVDSDADFEGELAAELEIGAQGIIDDANIDSLIVGGGIEMQLRHIFSNEADLEGRFRYNYLVSNAVNVSNDSLDKTNDFVEASGYLEASAPTGLTFLDREVRALGIGGSSFLQPEPTFNAEKTDFIHELGGGLELRGIGFTRKVRLRATALFGEDVHGWRAGISVKF